MNPASQLYPFVRFANSLLFACGLALMLDQSTATALDRFEQVAHWHSDDRALIVVDKTGDRNWNDATRLAVDAWNQPSAGTGLHLTWTTGTGGCAPAGNRIEICQETYQMLGGGIHDDREGLTDVRLGSDRSQSHIGGATISVCSNCRVESPRRRVIATHELGHSLGLDHSARLGSVMYPRGGPDRPAAGDVTSLRQLYGHVDRNDRCGVFDLQVGLFCF